MGRFAMRDSTAEQFVKNARAVQQHKAIKAYDGQRLEEEK
jgi:hypothetical protein